MNSQFIKVGKIVNTFGIKGELKVYLYTDFPEQRFNKDNMLYLGLEDSPAGMIVEIQSSKPYKNVYLVKFKGFDDINYAEKYKNYFLWITKGQQTELDEGEYYYHQIIGCKVLTIDGEELGIIKEIISPGANDVWVVKPFEGKKEILIPYIDSVVKEVNVEEKKVIIELMEGLLD